MTTLEPYRNGGRMFVPGNKRINGEILVDEIKIPNPQGIRAIRLTSESTADRYGIGLHTSSLYEEAGVLTVDMSDNASIRYSAEAIGKLALNLPTIASASWFETFNQFASAEVDRMFGVERRVRRVGENINPSLPADTTGSGGGTTGGTSTGASVYVCHDGSTLRIDAYSLPSYIARGATLGQCGSVASSGRSGRSGSGSGRSGSGRSGSGQSGSGQSGSGGLGIGVEIGDVSIGL